MDLGEQPIVLSSLTQVEEMLIARVNPILQVTHTCGGQYKCIGHTISFPQDIATIANYLPRHVQDLDMLVVTHRTFTQKNYDCIASGSHVLVALQYKLEHGPYYQDVCIDNSAL